MADADVSDESILGERGLRYKRNTLVASLIATVLYLTDAPLGKAELFGVGLSGVKDQEAAAWGIFLAILGYQLVMLAYYGLMDWRIWQYRIKETFKLSPWNIAFWMREGAKTWEHGLPTNSAIASLSESPQHINWQSRAPNGASGLRKNLARTDQENIRWRLTAFLTIEFGWPYLWGLACAGIAMTKVFG